jgi:uncharacterized NAD(P)/FAD-binding protein YdhS
MVPIAAKKIAVIGMGASSLYLLKNLLERAKILNATIGQVTFFERGEHPGVGMPYNRETTDKHNICNISSEEIPKLQLSFADWLRQSDDATLGRFGIKREAISDSETYPRLLLGEYFEDQCRRLMSQLREKRIDVGVRLGVTVTDLRDEPQHGRVVVAIDGSEETFDRVVIATGHSFPPSDDPANGYYASPWPMQKLLPAEGEHHNFTIGTLGASLSAFDVVTSLAHRHGRFERDGDRLKFIADPRAKRFKIVMHSSNGWLPHLQYEQCKTFREVYRPIDREALLALRDENGFLRLDTYFDHVCRPALAKAFSNDRREDIASKLREPDFSIESFVAEMSEEHAYDDAFEGLKREYPQARRSVRDGEPIHWKETLDDVMYTLSYHGELMPAEDHVRLKKVVMPFLLNVIAALPLKSADILLALHEAGRLELLTGKVEVQEKTDGQTEVEVDDEGERQTIRYKMFIDCSGQPPVETENYPFPALVKQGAVRAARVRFADIARAEKMCQDDDACLSASDGPRYLLPGIDIDGAYRVIGEDGRANSRIFDIAFPHTSGLRPYSYGLQACNHTAGIVVEAWRLEAEAGTAPSSGTATLTKLHDTVPNES